MAGSARPAIVLSAHLLHRGSSQGNGWAREGGAEWNPLYSAETSDALVIALSRLREDGCGVTLGRLMAKKPRPGSAHGRGQIGQQASVEPAGIA